jgi:hypothetical protein
MAGRGGRYPKRRTYNTLWKKLLRLLTAIVNKNYLYHNKNILEFTNSVKFMLSIYQIQNLHYMYFEINLIKVF